MTESQANADLLLVSGSPRRRELLDLIGVRYRVHNADIDESALPGEAPGDLVCRLALAKAREGLSMANGLPALGADTIVLLEGQVLGKPRSREQAAEMLGGLAGHTHEVLTAVAVVAADGEVHETLNVTAVTFSEIPRAWIDAYCRTDEPMDKAGAYAVQGLTAQWISEIRGSYSGVMGLPLHETAALLRSAGLSVLDQPVPGHV